MSDCWKCDGTGIVNFMFMDTDCPVCMGTGWIDDEGTSPDPVLDNMVEPYMAAEAGEGEGTE